MNQPSYPLTVTLQQLCQAGVCREARELIRAAHPGAEPNDPLLCAELAGLVGVQRALWAGFIFPELAAQLVTDYAARVLYIFEAEQPGDHRPRRALEAARLAGVVGVPAVRAASDAAYAAAPLARARTCGGSAAFAAAYAANHAAYVTEAAYGTAYAATAASILAGATYNAAADAVEAERFWQMKRLQAYCSGPVAPWPLPPHPAPLV